MPQLVSISAAHGWLAVFLAGKTPYRAIASAKSLAAAQEHGLDLAARQTTDQRFGSPGTWAGTKRATSLPFTISDRSFQ
jgi:hypothetical protein